jgi:hypothetical protein
MKENTSEDCDPPPDSHSPIKYDGQHERRISVYFKQDSPYSVSSLDDGLDREYRNFVLPNEDDDPEYFKTLLRSYRGENTMFVMDRGWQF